MVTRDLLVILGSFWVGQRLRERIPLIDSSGLCVPLVPVRNVCERVGPGSARPRTERTGGRAGKSRAYFRWGRNILI
jgi:hypothetical protein